MGKKLNAVVVYGGQSTEHEVSRRSASYIWRNIDRTRFEAFAIGIDKSGRWLAQDRQLLAENHLQEMPLHEAGDDISQALLRRIWTPAADLHDTVIFNTVHGTTGEDGMLQGFFDLQGIAYVGPGILGSAVAMDKVIAKELVAAAGIPIVPYVALRLESWKRAKQDYLQQISARLQYPLFVKPASLGSSVGVRKVGDSVELIAAIDNAFTYDEKILVETGFDAREIEFACLGGYSPRVSGPGEVAAGAGFYSYEEKYSQTSRAEVLVPAPLDPQLTAQGQELSLRIFQALGLFGMARIDLFLTKKTAEFYFNEANTLPGMTAISQFPKLWEHAGMSGKELISALLDSALERRLAQKALLRSI